MGKYLMWVLWPSFLAASIGVGILFSLVDPSELIVFGSPIHVDRMSAYSVGFFLLWALCSASSALSCFLLVNLAEGRSVRQESADDEGQR